MSTMLSSSRAVDTFLTRPDMANSNLTGVR